MRAGAKLTGSVVRSEVDFMEIGLESQGKLIGPVVRSGAVH